MVFFIPIFAMIVILIILYDVISVCIVDSNGLRCWLFSHFIGSTMRIVYLRTFIVIFIKYCLELLCPWYSHGRVIRFWLSPLAFSGLLLFRGSCFVAVRLSSWSLLSGCLSRVTSNTCCSSYLGSSRMCIGILGSFSGWGYFYHHSSATSSTCHQLPQGLWWNSVSYYTYLDRSLWI